MVLWGTLRFVLEKLRLTALLVGPSFAVDFLSFVAHSSEKASRLQTAICRQQVFGCLRWLACKTRDLTKPSANTKRINLPLDQLLGKLLDLAVHENRTCIGSEETSQSHLNSRFHPLPCTVSMFRGAYSCEDTNGTFHVLQV